MLKKYDSIKEAKMAKVYYVEEMKKLENEVLELKRALWAKKDLLEAAEKNYNDAIDQMVDMELNEYYLSLNNEDKEEDDVIDTFQNIFS